MKRIISAAMTVLLGAAGAGLPAYGEERDAAIRESAIHGRIVDSGRQVLPGASVFVEKLHTGVVSDINGFYTLPNLRPGVL